MLQFAEWVVAEVAVTVVFRLGLGFAGDLLDGGDETPEQCSDRSDTAGDTHDVGLQPQNTTDDGDHGGDDRDAEREVPGDGHAGVSAASATGRFSQYKP